MKSNMNTRRLVAGALASIAITAVGAAAGPSGGAFEIVSYTIDAGGTSSTTGGSYELAGTIGQPDAGVEMTGGSFSLTGGFWAGVSTTPACDADLNGDGFLNFFDISAFLGFFSAMDPVADFNGDGFFNFFDISAFLVAFSAGCP
ncbi:hypothetical protein COB72_05480 [bacterium]|nr:MAG: hypothetical protein COB72_05480 [bacterium]